MKQTAATIIIVRRPNASDNVPASAAPTAQPSSMEATLKPVPISCELKATRRPSTVPLMTPESKPKRNPPIVATAVISRTWPKLPCPVSIFTVDDASLIPRALPCFAAGNPLPAFCLYRSLASNVIANKKSIKIELSTLTSVSAATAPTSRGDDDAPVAHHRRLRSSTNGEGNCRLFGGGAALII